MTETAEDLTPPAVEAVADLTPPTEKPKRQRKAKKEAAVEGTEASKTETKPASTRSNLSKMYPVIGGSMGSVLLAFVGFDLLIVAGECVGMVGDSGCGK